MASTLLEQTRAAHEEVERTVHRIVKDLKTDKKKVRLLRFPSHLQRKEKILQQHRVDRLVGIIQSRSLELLQIYEDKEGLPPSAMA